MKYKIKEIKTDFGIRFFVMKKRLFRWRFLGGMTGKIVPSRIGWVKASFSSRAKAKNWLKEKVIKEVLLT